MKTSKVLPLTVFTFIFLLISCQSNTDQKEKNIHPSGAAHSLDQFTHLRTYPDGKFHNKKYQEAFLEKQIQALTETGGDGEFEALGPKNIGGRTLCMAFDPVDPFTIYAGAASGGLWKSTSMGAGANAWEPIETGFPVIGVAAIAIPPDNPDVIYIGTGEVYNFNEASIGNIRRITRGTYGVGILKSEDGGATWSKSLDWDLDDFTGVQDIVIDPMNPSTVFAATTEGLYRSQDAGNTWDQLNEFSMVHDIEINSQNPDVIYFSHGGLNNPTAGIYKSIDGGETFTKLINGLPLTWDGKAMLGLSQSSPNEIYASIANAFSSIGLYKSIDAGDNWTLISDQDVAVWQGWYSHDIAVNPALSSDIVYAGFEVFKSTNAGASFYQVGFWDLGAYGQIPIGGPEGPPNYVHGDVHQVKHHPSLPNIVFAMTDGGIFASNFGGDDWEGRNGGYQTQQFYADFSNSSTDSLLAIGGMQDNHTGMYTGSDAWSKILIGDGMCTAIDQTNDENIYGSYQYLQLFKSDDRGDFFYGISPSFNAIAIFSAPFVLAPTDQSTIYAGALGLFISTNGGNTWTASPSVSGDNRILTIAVSPSDKDLIFVSTVDFLLSNAPTVAKTTDGGQTWEEITGLPDRNASDIAFDPIDDQIVYITFSGFFTDHVYKTTDGGLTWNSISNGLPDVPTNTIVVDPLDGNIIYVGNDLGVYCSTDGGNSWELFSGGLPDAVLVMHLSISPSNRKLRVATHGRGVFQGDLIDPALTATKNLEKIGLKNLTTFPNPVVDQSTVRFYLEQKTEIHLSLVSVDGKTNQVLFTGTKESGVQEFNFNWESLPSGVYFYRLNVKISDRHNKVVKSLSFVR